MKTTVKTFLCFVLCLMALSGCTTDTIENPDNINCHTFEYKNDTDALKQNKVVFGKDGVLYNAGLLEDFINVSENGQPIHTDFAALSKEGDWIIFCVDFDGEIYRIVKDSSRDRHDKTDVSQMTFSKAAVSQFERESLHYIVLENSETQEQLILCYY